MKCWICGSEGNTGEHLIKASDLKGYFGVINEDLPVFYHTNEKKNVKIKSIKSNKFKSNALICAKCNNNLSQPYDKAWERLSNYLRENWIEVSRQKVVPLKNVFLKDIDDSMRDVQLFFVKLFGCRIVEHGIPIDIKSFSTSFLKRDIHSDIFISIGRMRSGENVDVVSMSDIQAVNVGNTVVCARWIYLIGELAVEVVYDTNRLNKKMLRRCWTPKNHGCKLHIHKF